MLNAATRSPLLTGAPSGALRTTPPTSLPGTNGSGGFIWYSPRVWRSSGNDTPAACTSTTTPRPGVIGCDGFGSGSSTSFSAPGGPLRSTIWIALTARTLHDRLRATVGAARSPPPPGENSASDDASSYDASILAGLCSLV